LQAVCSEALFCVEGLVAGEKHIHSTLFGCAQEVAVLHSRPAHIADGDYFVIAEKLSQRMVEVLVEQNPQLWAWSRWAWANSISRLI